VVHALETAPKSVSRLVRSRVPAANQLQGFEAIALRRCGQGGARVGSSNVCPELDHAMSTLRHLVAVALFAAVHMTQAQDDPATKAAIVQTVDALMPALPAGAAGTGQADQYLCTSVPLPDAPLKLNSIVPKPGPGVTHMLLFGERPGLGWGPVAGCSCHALRRVSPARGDGVVA